MRNLREIITNGKCKQNVTTSEERALVVSLNYPPANTNKYISDCQRQSLDKNLEKFEGSVKKINQQ